MYSLNAARQGSEEQTAADCVDGARDNGEASWITAIMSD